MNIARPEIETDFFVKRTSRFEDGAVRFANRAVGNGWLEQQLKRLDGLVGIRLVPARFLRPADTSLYVGESDSTEQSRSACHSGSSVSPHGSVARREVNAQRVVNRIDVLVAAESMKRHAVASPYVPIRLRGCGRKSNERPPRARRQLVGSQHLPAASRPS